MTGKTFPAFPVHTQPVIFSVSGKWPMDCAETSIELVMICLLFSLMSSFVWQIAKASHLMYVITDSTLGNRVYKRSMIVFRMAERVFEVIK